MALVDALEGWRGVRTEPYLNERLKQMPIAPGSNWEDADLKKLAV